MDSNLILASGPPMSWKEYRGGQKNAILGGAVHEGLADTKEKAEEEIEKGNIQVSSCQEYNCVGSLAGIYTASMPVLVVEDKIGKSTRLNSSHVSSSYAVFCLKKKKVLRTT